MRLTRGGGIKPGSTRTAGELPLRVSCKLYKWSQNMNAKQSDNVGGSTGQFNSNPEPEVEQVEREGKSRRSFLTKIIAAGAATAVTGFPYIRARAAEPAAIKFGL